MQRTRCLLAVTGLLLTAWAPAQSPLANGTASPPVQAAASKPVAGSFPGSERWVVHFKSRSFDLTAFREAVYARRSAAEVDKIIARMEDSVHRDQAGFVKAVRALGGKIIYQWWLVNAAAIDVLPKDLARVRALPNVARIEPDLETFPIIKVATNSLNHNSDAVNTAGNSGLGVATAIMDTGQDSNMANSGRPHRMYFIGGNINNKTGGGIGGSRLLVNKKLGLMPADDVNRHGTGVASIAAGANWGTSGADNGHAPRAGIAGYSIANNTRGSSTFTVMANAWQAIAADRVRLNIVSANNSYTGSPDPQNIGQMALDSAAFNADIMICIAAGNSASSTRVSQATLNGLAVAALNKNSHTVASFSSRGPHFNNPQRFFPDISGIGVSLVMAFKDLEASNWIASGTSMASPEVCGAATLLRAANKTLKADETKAILLATTLDISAKNPNPPFNSRNAYGMGLLRDDRAVAIANKAAQHQRSTLTATKKTWVWPVRVLGGKFYAVAIAWHRTIMTNKNYSNLDLEILDSGSNVIASSKTPANLYEMVRFRAKATGTLVARVTAVTLQSTSQPFGFAATETAGAPIPGTYTTFGTGCKGTGQGGGGNCTARNLTCTSGFLAGNTNFFGLGIKETQTKTVLGLTLRTKSRSGTQTGKIELWLATTAGKPTTRLRTGTITVGTTYANYSGRFTTPAVIPASQPFVVVFGLTSLINHPICRTGGVRTSYFWHPPTSTVWRGPFTQAWTFRVDCAGSTSGAVPLLTNTGVPEIGKSFKVGLVAAAKNTAAVLFLGASKTKWNALNLPFDLTAFGAPGCKVLASGEIQVAFPTGAGGSASATLTLPNNRSMVGALFFNQWIVKDQGANGLGVALSNGGQGKIGGTP